MFLNGIKATLPSSIHREKGGLNELSGLNGFHSVNDEFPERAEQSVFNEPRHNEVIEGLKELPNQNWRTKERMKTMSVAIVLCLNVGVDPPDVVKPNPCAVLQSWTDPFSSQPTKAAETIATKLIKQYERWQPRARYKHCIDPTVEDIRKLCTTLRRTSKEERVLFHYNGHGVPKPTVNGEIWVFNRSFTQYIPLSLYDLQQWMGSPSIYVFDCSNAGVIVELFNQFAIQHQKEYEMNLNSNSYYKDEQVKVSPPPNYQNCILLAACDKGETLPLHPDLPADLFTSCLTTPIKTFLVWFMKRNSRKLAPNISIDLIDKIPGSLTDRKSILGELNWIFTAITDTIAWNTLPRELFQRLFRQDLLVASLFRNFLLAQRIMRSYDCTPVSNPPIKSVHHHPMWNAWDLAVDSCLSQLAQFDLASNKTPAPPPYTPSQFFTEQLTAFQVWLKLSSFPSSTPEQLPIVLQVLLSQVHRSRALDLLGNFLNLGPWAVNLALSVGIFPYVLKLLQASARELRPFLVFIWAKILAIDESYQSELIRENAHRYFMNILSDSNISTNHQIMSAFVLSVIVRHNPTGQNTVVQGGGVNQCGSIIDMALTLLMDQQQDHPNLRKWLLICLGNVWEHNEDVRWLATRSAVYAKLFTLLDDPVPEVRAAAVYSLGTFINSITQRNEQANDIDCNIASTLVQKLFYDSSPLVRKELLVSLHWFIIVFENHFLANYRKRAFEEHIKLQQLQQAQPGKGKDHSPQNSLSSVSAMQNILSSASNHVNGRSRSGLHLLPTMLIATAIEPTTLTANGSPTASNMRKISSSSRLSNLSSNIANKFLSVPVSITVPANLANAPSNSEHTPPNSMKRVNSINSLSNLSINSTASVSSKALPTVYSRVWQLIELYMLDPVPEVHEMASLIYMDIHSKAFTCAEAMQEQNGGSVAFAVSESESPTQQEANVANESPELRDDLEDSTELTRSSSRTSTPVRDTAAKHHSGRVSVSATSSPYLPHSNNYASFMNQYSLKRTMFGREPVKSELNEPRQRNGTIPEREYDMQRSENSFSSDSQVCRKPLVQTGFIEWSTKHFCQPCSHLGICGCANVEMSPPDMVGEWRSALLRKYYHKAKTELQLPHKTGGTDVIARRSADVSLISLHPFEKCVVFANSSTFSIWNYGQSSVTSPYPEPPLKKFRNESANAKITDMKLINTHDKALLMVASNNGAIKVWSDLLPTTFSNLYPEDDTYGITPRLATAFFIFEDMPLRPVERSNLVLCWEQEQKRLVAGGEHRFIRLWDANKEMKIRDIVTGTEAITSLGTDNDHVICAGCKDGAVRLFDDRQKSTACQVFSSGVSSGFSSRTGGPIVNAKIWSVAHADSINLVSGSKFGDVCWFDKRIASKAVQFESKYSPMTAMNFHENTNVFACAFDSDANSELQLYTLDILKGPTLKSRSRIVKSLSFHSLKAKFAVATNDGLAIYKSSFRVPTVSIV